MDENQMAGILAALERDGLEGLDDHFLTEYEVTAYHEAGHAVIQWLLGLQVIGLRVGNLTDKDGDEWGGQAECSGNASVNNDEAGFLATLAGAVAEAMLVASRDSKDGTINSLAVEKDALSRLLSKRVFSRSVRAFKKSDLGMVQRMGRKYLPKGARVNNFVKAFGMPLVLFLVTLHWDLISALAEELMQAGHMDGMQVDLFIRQHQISKMKQLDFGPVLNDDR